MKNKFQKPNRPNSYMIEISSIGHNKKSSSFFSPVIDIAAIIMATGFLFYMWLQI